MSSPNPQVMTFTQIAKLRGTTRLAAYMMFKRHIDQLTPGVDFIETSTGPRRVLTVDGFRKLWPSYTPPAPAVVKPRYQFAMSVC